jgi:hypothetical protein
MAQNYFNSGNIALKEAAIEWAEVDRYPLITGITGSPQWGKR